jgi:serine/threonine protein kinase
VEAFGKYFLLERLNASAMAEVYKAKTVGVEGFEKIVAIKRVLPAAGEAFLKLFIGEAKITSQLSHANLLHTFDLGRTEEGAWYVAMEYVPGKDLRAIAQAGKQMPLPLAAWIMSRVLDGLDYAHRKRDPNGRELNVVHGAISPRNILLSYDGEVKLIDFGLPETAGKPDDIHAAGVTLYELCKGEAPTGPGLLSLPHKLARVIARALAPEKDRYQTAEEMSVDLTRYLLEEKPKAVTRDDAAAFLREAFPEAILDAPPAEPEVPGAPPPPSSLDVPDRDEGVVGAGDLDRTQKGFTADEPKAEIIVRSKLASTPPPPPVESPPPPLQTAPVITAELAPPPPIRTAEFAPPPPIRTAEFAPPPPIRTAEFAPPPPMRTAEFAAPPPSAPPPPVKSAPPARPVSLEEAEAAERRSFTAMMLRTKPASKPSFRWRYVAAAGALAVLAGVAFMVWPEAKRARRAKPPPIDVAVALPVEAPPQPQLINGDQNRISVASSPPGAQVWVDGIQRGVTPLVLPPLDAQGTHAISVEKKCYRGWQVALPPNPGRRELAATLAPQPLTCFGTRLEKTGMPVVPGGEPILGFLNLESKPAAQVLIDGVDLGQSTPLLGWPLQAGSHQVSLVKGKQTASVALEIRAGETLIESVALEAAAKRRRRR